jgi:hypothetical protein
VKPLKDLTKEKFKRQNFQFSTRVKVALKQLKITLTTASIVPHFDPKLPSVVETDACDCAISKILSQVEDGCLKPVTSHFRQMDKAEINYDIYHK